MWANKPCPHQIISGWACSWCSAFWTMCVFMNTRAYTYVNCAYIHTYTYKYMWDNTNIHKYTYMYMYMWQKHVCDRRNTFRINGFDGRPVQNIRVLHNQYTFVYTNIYTNIYTIHTHSYIRVYTNIYTCKRPVKPFSNQLILGWACSWCSTLWTMCVFMDTRAYTCVNNVYIHTYTYTHMWSICVFIYVCDKRNTVHTKWFEGAPLQVFEHLSMHIQYTHM